MSTLNKWELLRHFIAWLESNPHKEFLYNTRYFQQDDPYDYFKVDAK